MDEIGFWICVVVGVVVHELAHILAVLFFVAKKWGMRKAWDHLINERSFAVSVSSITLCQVFPFFRRKQTGKVVKDLLDTSFSQVYMHLVGPISHLLVCVAIVVLFHDKSWYPYFLGAWAGVGLHNIWPRFLPHEECRRDGEFAMFFLFCSAPSLVTKFFPFRQEKIEAVAEEQTELNYALEAGKEDLSAIARMTPCQVIVAITVWWITIAFLTSLALWSAFLMFSLLIK